MHTLKQNISIRSQAAFVIALVAFGWLAGSVQAQTGSSSWAGVVDIVWYAIPIFYFDIAGVLFSFRPSTPKLVLCSRASRYRIFFDYDFRFSCMIYPFSFKFVVRKNGW